MNKITTEEIAIEWSIQRFDQLTASQLYSIMQLRVDVFIVEQTCVYRELDGLDILPNTVHILGYSQDCLVAYARAMAPEDALPVKIGRVVIHLDYRRFGLAREMMNLLLSDLRTKWPNADLFLSAQTQVAGFYRSLGFQQISAEYVEDGIPHIDMKSECKDDT